MINYQEGYHRYRRYYRRLGGLYQKQEVKDFTFLILSLLTAAFFAFFAIKPSVRTIGGLVKEIKDKRVSTKKLEEKINALSLAQKEYNRVQADLPLIYSALPPKNDSSKLVKQLEYLAIKDNVTLPGLRLQEVTLFTTQPPTSLTPLDFSLTISGQYLDLKTFLADLERLERIVVLETFSFAQKKAKIEDESSLSLNIKMKGYYFP